MRILGRTIAIALLAAAATSCVSDSEIEDGENDAFPSGKADGGIDEGSPEALGVLALVNDPGQTAATLKAGAHITIRVARNIVAHRDGADATPGTDDDNRFDTLGELDAIPYVGPATLQALIDLAKQRGLVHEAPSMRVIFSPQPAASSSNAAIAQAIHGAQHTVDIAIYSYSDAGIAAALADAVSRGVRVRFLFDTASEDRKQTDATKLATTASGRLEKAGVDVRWVNKILHHKFLIVDGPRDDKSLAESATLVMGSANWTSTGSTVFDENTVIIQHSAELVAAYQHEFDSLWKGSRELAAGAPSQGPSTANITIADVPDDAGIEAKFTSANMTPGGSDGSTWRTDNNSLAMASVWVDAIEHAHTSIHIASTHLRMRPVVEALIAKKQAQPSIDIELYLDQQEWISTSGDNAQASDLTDCLAAATTDTQKRDCAYNDYLFSKMVADAGIDVRFKSYAYRWDATYAIQQHSKYMVVDGKELITGSYNLSMNSEHETFENAIHVTGAAYAPLVAQFEHNFATIFETGRAQGLLDSLRTKVTTASVIPMVFDPMALTWSELDQLRTLIRQNCSAADSAEFRDNPPAHRSCTR
jgi:phosphatidylserine/phosphatidylglycerophosphate/cardiolipin synthase-like enzyme